VLHSIELTAQEKEEALIVKKGETLGTYEAEPCMKKKGKGEVVASSML